MYEDETLVMKGYFIFDLSFLSGEVESYSKMVDETMIYVSPCKVILSGNDGHHWL